MKKTCLIAIVVLTALLLFGCEKAVWLPLWSTPMPGHTSALHATTVKATATPSDAGSYFTTDVDHMDHPKVVIFKAKRMLEIYDGNKLMARMKIALGTAPVGAKLESGDNKTPEGDYYICTRNATSKFGKSLCISYPNESDAVRGLDAGLIDQDQYGTIAEAIDQKKTPLWSTRMGGEIAINAYGEEGKGKTGDWTAGNIAISDKDMEYFWKFVKEGVDVQINP